MPERSSTDRARKSLARARLRAADERQAAAEGRAAEALADGSLEAHKDEHPGFVEGCESCDDYRLKHDHRYFIESCLWVPHIDGGKVIPFTLNPGQLALSIEIEKLREKREPVRAIVLKSRKHGISTFCQALAYQYCSTHEYVNGLVITDKKEKSSTILDLTKKFHMLDERKALSKRPLVEASNKLEFKFGNPDARTRDTYPGLQSRLEITSSEAGEPGRSGTYHFVHASECAYWEKDVWNAVGPALMFAPDTFAIMESTANGASGMFHDHYQESKEGRTGWAAIFLSWLIDPRCRRAVSRLEKQRWEWESRAERDYAERYKLNLEQAQFRRVQLHNPDMRKAGMTPEDVFDEEYPATDELAFKGSGKLFFLASTLEALEKSSKGVRPPLLTGKIESKTSLEDRGPGRRTPVVVVVSEEYGGPLKIWEHPRKDCEYIVSADVALGLSHGDNHQVVVLRRDTCDAVASWRTNDATSRTLGQVACLLGWHYGDALVAIEQNAYGVAAIQEAQRIMYPRLWHHLDVRKEGAEPTDRAGWITTDAVRPYMLSALDFAIRDASIAVHDKVFYTECKTFENIEGKPQARAGKHDDWIMAGAIGFQVHLHCGPIRRLPNPQAAQRLPGPRLTPDWPEQGKVPIAQVSGKVRRVRAGSCWGEE